MSKKFKIFATLGAYLCVFSYAACSCVCHACNNEINRQFHLNNTQVGILFMLVFLGFIPTSLITGALSDKKGKLPFICLGVVLMAIGSILFITTKNYYVALLSMFLMGAGGGCSEANATCFMGDIFEGTQRIKMMNLVQTFYGLGAFLAPFLAGAFLNYFNSYNLAFVIVCGFCLLSLIFSLISYFQKEEKPVRVEKVKVPWNVILKDCFILWVVGSLVLYCGSEIGFSEWVAVYFEKYLNVTPYTAAQSVSFIWLGIAIGSYLASLVAKKLTPEQIIKISLVCLIVSHFVFRSSNVIVAFVGVFFVGLFLGPIFPTVIALGSSKYKEHSGAVGSILFCCANLGCAFFPALMGYFVDLTSIATAMWFVVILAFVNLGLYFVKIKN